MSTLISLDKKMKTLKTVGLLFAFFAMFSATSFATVCDNCGKTDAQMMKAIGGNDDEASLMTISVKKLKKPEQIEKLKAQLMELKGVKSVSGCTESGTVKITYNKAELGCCSKIHSSLENNGWKYAMVSNVEKPACEGKKACPSKCAKKSSES